MDYAKKTCQLLDDLRKMTGLELSVSGSSLDDQNIEKTYENLRLLCNSCRQSGSVEALIRRWIMGECSEGDFLSSASALHMDTELPRSLCYMELDGRINDSVISTIEHVIADRPHAVIIRISDSALVILDHCPVHNQAMQNERPAFYSKAENILTFLNTELYINARAACTSVCACLKELPNAYREAVFALKVGMIFQPEKNIYSYENMGESRLFYGLESKTCSEYISETLGHGFNPSKTHVFDGDILYTAESFLKNDFNIAETARILHIHRNTLLYRINLIQKETGLDIRHFQDAMRYYLSSLIITKKKLPE